MSCQLLWNSILADCERHFHLFYTIADKPEKFLSYLEVGKHPNVKLTVKYSNHKTFPFLDDNVTINQDNLPTSL